MRRLARIAIAAFCAAFGAAWIRRLLQPADRGAKPASRPQGDPAPERSVPSEPDDGAQQPTREQLYVEAQRLEIQGRSKMNKQELLEAVQTAEAGVRA